MDTDAGSRIQTIDYSRFSELAAGLAQLDRSAYAATGKDSSVPVMGLRLPTATLYPPPHPSPANAVWRERFLALPQHRFDASTSDQEARP